MTIEDVILNRLSLQPCSNIYWVGRKAMRLTFLSQQQRALNLIWALHKTGTLASETKVTVVGAGLAGLTAAFAAHKLGSRVTLIERKREPLHLQRGCQLRFVHPYILDWPEPISERSFTDLPCLNWGAATAADVASTILEEWKDVEPLLDVYYGYDVRDISAERDGHCFVRAEGESGNYESRCDCLILAVGFGLERSLPSVPFLSYWENDNFGRPLIKGTIRRRYLVTGCGDGGLIDAIRLRFNAFDHADFVYHLSTTKDLDEIKTRLPEIDREVTKTLITDPENQKEIEKRLEDSRKLFGNTFDEVKATRRIEQDIQSRLLEERYSKLDIPKELREWIERNLRKDTIVSLNSPCVSPLTLGASILRDYLKTPKCPIIAVR